MIYARKMLIFISERGRGTHSLNNFTQWNNNRKQFLIHFYAVVNSREKIH